MEQMNECESAREEIKGKLRQYFDGKIVRKDLTKKIKEGANVPVFRRSNGFLLTISFARMKHRKFFPSCGRREATPSLIW